MVSDLYDKALRHLSDAGRRRFLAFRDWLDGPPKSLAEGKKLFANIEMESHLVGDGDFGNPETFCAFLASCAVDQPDAGTEDDRRAGFCSACAEHERRGLPIPPGHLPGTLYRYCTSRWAVSKVLERLLGVAARVAFDSGTMSPEDAFSRIEWRWSQSAMTDTERLGGRDTVFATFDFPDVDSPRDNAAAMAAALALEVGTHAHAGDEILFELTYETASVRDHRFPTVADVGTFHLFQPADETAPDVGTPETCCGWTAPLAGQPRQPELVHENESLRILEEPPRLVGRVGR